MSAALHNASGPAEAATSPDLGSIYPFEAGIEMNDAATNTRERITLPPHTRKHIEDAIEALIVLLDYVDGDPDIEEDEGEPSEVAQTEGRA